MVDFPLVRSGSISQFHTMSSIYLCFGGGSPYHHLMVRSLRAVTNCILDKLRRIFNPNIDPTSTQLIQGLTCAFRMICQEGRKICFHCRPIKVISQQNTTGSHQLEGLCNFQFCFSFQVSGIQIQKVLGFGTHGVIENRASLNELVD